MRLLANIIALTSTLLALAKAAPVADAAESFSWPPFKVTSLHTNLPPPSSVYTHVSINFGLLYPVNQATSSAGTACHAMWYQNEAPPSSWTGCFPDTTFEWYAAPFASVNNFTLFVKVINTNSQSFFAMGIFNSTNLGCADGSDGSLMCALLQPMELPVYKVGY